MKQTPEIPAKQLLEAFSKFSRRAALDFGRETITYGDLGRKASGMAGIIKDFGTSNDPVAILGRKGMHTYAGVCGSLLASRAYMPLNLRFPLARNVKMLERSKASVIIAYEASAEMLEAILKSHTFPGLIIFEGDHTALKKKYPRQAWQSAGDATAANLQITAKPDDTAYLLFTSGTTGMPKGVPVSNSNLAAYLEHILQTYEIHPDDRFSQTFDLTFDLSVHDMMVCWLSGACLCIPPDESALRMAHYIRDQRISVWFSVPSLAVLMDRMRLVNPGAFNGIRLSFFCGEPLPVELAKKWQEATRSRVVNLYGPSEATIAISEYELCEDPAGRNGILSIGKLFPGQEYLLINPENLQAVQQSGELCLGGSQVIDAYLDDPELSKKYFLSVEGSEKTWYRTGDLVETHADGNLCFMGRTDAEVKLSGFRVNLLEVDAVLRKFNGTGQVATVFDDARTPRLVAFAERTGDHSENELIGLCRNELPWYMIPEVIIFVEEMPLNANGKIDRNELKNSLNG